MRIAPPTPTELFRVSESVERGEGLALHIAAFETISDGAGGDET